MKTKKRITVTSEHFESTVIKLKQKSSQVYCANCQQEVLEVPITQIAFVQIISKEENIYLFVTDSGMVFLLEVL